MFDSSMMGVVHGLVSEEREDAIVCRSEKVETKVVDSKGKTKTLTSWVDNADKAMVMNTHYLGQLKTMMKTKGVKQILPSTTSYGTPVIHAEEIMDEPNELEGVVDPDWSTEAMAKERELTKRPQLFGFMPFVIQIRGNEERGGEVKRVYAGEAMLAGLNTKDGQDYLRKHAVALDEFNVAGAVDSGMRELTRRQNLQALGDKKEKFRVYCEKESLATMDRAKLVEALDAWADVVTKPYVAPAPEEPSILSKKRKAVDGDQGEDSEDDDQDEDAGAILKKKFKL